MLPKPSSMGPVGHEPEHVTDRKSRMLQNSQISDGAESGAQSAKNASNHTNRLAVITDLLTDLPDNQRAKIIAELAPADRVAIVQLLIRKGDKP